MHSPQPMQVSWSIAAVPSTVIASAGHHSAQTAQAPHFSSSIRGL